MDQGFPELFSGLARTLLNNAKQFAYRWVWEEETCLQRIESNET